MCLPWEALDALPKAREVSKWPPAVPLVLPLQCDIADGRSTAGGLRASSGEINKQATTNDSRIESSRSFASCYKA